MLKILQFSLKSVKK